MYSFLKSSEANEKFYLTLGMPQTGAENIIEALIKDKNKRCALLKSYYGA